MKKTLRVVGYVRVSQTNGRAGERFISPKVQREALSGFVTGRGHQLVTVETDLDESGGTLQRPGLQRALAMLDAGDADAICVARLDRLSRRVVDGLTLVQQVAGLGCHVLIADLDLDSSTPTGKAMLTVVLTFAELELDQRRASWAIAQRNALERGIYPGNTPLGYGRDTDGRMVPDRVAGKAIRDLYRRRAAGESWASLARWFDKRLPRDDGAPWRPSTIRGLLKTPQNIGRLERRVAGELVVIDNAHEPLIDRATYEAALAASNGARGPRHRPEPAKLAALAKCGTCGGTMSRAGSGTRKSYESYTCTTRCAAPAKMSVTALDRHVLDRLVDRLTESEQVVGARLRKKRAASVQSIEAALADAEAELAAYLGAVSVADVGAEAFAEGARTRRAVVDEQRAALARALRDVNDDGIDYDDYADLLERLPDMSDSDVNAVMRRFVAQVIVAKAGHPGRRGDLHERVRVVWTNEDRAEGAAGVGDDLGRKRATVAA
jgi:site-specific DNA recombinase